MLTKAISEHIDYGQKGKEENMNSVRRNFFHIQLAKTYLDHTDPGNFETDTLSAWNHKIPNTLCI